MEEIVSLIIDPLMGLEILALISFRLFDPFLHLASFLDI